MKTPFKQIIIELYDNRWDVVWLPVNFYLEKCYRQIWVGFCIDRVIGLSVCMGFFTLVSDQCTFAIDVIYSIEFIVLDSIFISCASSSPIAVRSCTFSFHEWNGVGFFSYLFIYVHSFSIVKLHCRFLCCSV